MTDGRIVPARPEMPAIVPRDLLPLIAGSTAAWATFLRMVAVPGDNRTSDEASDRAA